MNTSTYIHLSVAKDFSKTPGPRTKAEGHFSAEEFLETLLKHRFDEAVRAKNNLVIDLDGGYGYGTSFLEEAFGGLARIRGIELVQQTLQFKSEEEPYLVDDVRRYIREAKKGGRR